MALPNRLPFLSIIFLESMFGTFMNVFIIFRIFFTYWKHKDVSGCEKIIAALVISNLCYTWANFANILIFNFWPFLYMIRQINLALIAHITFIFTTSAWLTASLCFYYYIKIKDFRSHLLSRLKMKMSSLASWMIAVSVIMSLLSTLFTVLQNMLQQHPSVSISMFSNSSWPYSSHGVFDINSYYITFVGNFIPFFISAGTTASVTWSLNLHRLKMARNQMSSVNSNVRNYEGAIKIMICLLTFYALIHVVMCLFYFNVFDQQSQSFWGFLVIICLYSPTQSILLSLSTTKLKRAWMKMFSCNSESMNDDDDDGNREE